MDLNDNALRPIILISNKFNQNTSHVNLSARLKGWYCTSQFFVEPKPTEFNSSFLTGLVQCGRHRVETKYIKIRSYFHSRTHITFWILVKSKISTLDEIANGYNRIFEFMVHPILIHGLSTRLENLCCHCNIFC